MDYKRIFRAAVCLLVVCCLVFNTAAPRAQAVAVVDDLAVGVLGYLIAMACGVVLTVETTQHLMAVGESFKTSMESWGTTEEKEDVVAAWLSGVSIEEGVDYIFSLPAELAAGAAVWLESVILGTTKILVEEDAAEGYAYYNGVLLPDISSYINETYSFATIVYDNSASKYCLYTTGASFYLLDGDFIYAKDAGFSYKKYYVYSTSVSLDATKSLSKGKYIAADHSFIWSNFDLKHSNTYAVICPASEPSIVLSNPIDDPAYFGDIPSDIQDGTLTADGITLPNTIDYTDLITDGSSVVDSVISLPGSIVDDDTYADALALLTLTYADTEVVPDTTTPVEPEETTPAVSLEGALSDVDVVAFVEFLVKSITAPLTIVADTITFTLKELFVPTEDFLTVKVDALRSEFAFADSIVSAGELVGSTLQSLETEPPVIYIDLSSARGSFAPGGKYPLGGKEVFIDMSWYAEYKPVGDALLSALLWIAFIWRMFIKLPGIISGMPGDFVMDGLHHIGLADRLPSRTASYEVQRISNRQSLRKGPGR